MVAAQPHLMKGIISFRATTLGGKRPFGFQVWGIFGKISMTLMLHLHIYVQPFSIKQL